MGGISAFPPERPLLAAAELLYSRSQSSMNPLGHMETMKGYCTLLSAEVRVS